MELSKMCPMCNTPHRITVDQEQYDRYMNGEAVQEAFADKDDFYREQILTGICYDCQSHLFNKPKPGEDWGDVVCECPNCGRPMYAKDMPICTACGANVEEFDDEA